MVLIYDGSGPPPGSECKSECKFECKSEYECEFECESESKTDFKPNVNLNVNLNLTSGHYSIFIISDSCLFIYTSHHYYGLQK